MQVLNDIKRLTTEKGFIYALCMIIHDDLSMVIDELDEVDSFSLLNVNEISLLLGFWIQNNSKFLKPDSPKDLIVLEEKIRNIMIKLHDEISEPMKKKLFDNWGKKNRFKTIRESQKDFFKDGDVLIEPIFYAGTGIYYFQFMELLEKKYKYDKEWLKKNKMLDLEEIKNLSLEIMEFFQKKSKKVIFHNKKEEKSFINKMKKEYPDVWEDIVSDIKIHKYFDFFIEKIKESRDFKELEKIKNIKDLDEENRSKLRGFIFDSILDGIIDLFTFKKEDFKKLKGLDSLLDNFSFDIEKEANENFQKVGSSNILNMKPIIKIYDEKYFVPIHHLLFKSIYESPFYWMMDDKKYSDTFSRNRGNASEDIAYEFLSNIFGKENTFKSVRVESKKGQDDTDIDVLCVLGSKALCVQVKSKKLTQLSRSGSYIHLMNDFKGSVQDAYEQGLVSRKKIIEKDAKFTDENGENLIFSEKIDESYIMGITTDEYPSLTYQSHILLDKFDENPFGLF